MTSVDRSTGKFQLRGTAGCPRGCWVGEWGWAEEVCGASTGLDPTLPY